MEREISIEVGDRSGSVDGLWLIPKSPRLVYVFAHGAGAGMRHAFMADLSRRLAEKDVATRALIVEYDEAGAPIHRTYGTRTPAPTSAP